MRTAPRILTIVTVLLCATACSRSTKGSENTGASPGSPAVNLREAVTDPGTLRRTSHSPTLPAGTTIPVELEEVIDSEAVGSTMFFIARVADNVVGPDGGVAIPAEASALIVIRTSERQGTQIRMALGLNRIGFGDKAYKAENGLKDIATLQFEDDVAKAEGHRTIHLQTRTLLNFKLTDPVGLQ